MGQTTSSTSSSYMAGTSPAPLGSYPTSARLANFHHVCNIIPDTPQHHHQIWTPDTDSSIVSGHEPSEHLAEHLADSSVSTQSSTRSTAKSRSNTHSCAHRSQSYNRRGKQSKQDKHNDSSRSCSEMSDISEDEYKYKHRYPTDEDSDIDTYVAKRFPLRTRNTNAQRKRANRKKTLTNAEEDNRGDNGGERSAMPPRVDRRFDLDIAPSMLNMDLKFNGAYMVASNLYSVLAHKYGYRHMLSIQHLFWLAVERYYQTTILDTNANYKLSIGAILEILRGHPLCSERELSIYTDVVQRHVETEHACHIAQAAKETTHGDVATKEPQMPHVHGNTFTTRHLCPRDSPMNRLSKPFYRLQCYYVPKDTQMLQHALCTDHLVLANLTLFSNFLSTRRGVVSPPNSDDTPVGMVVVTLVGYQPDVWIARFPFGMHWGDQGVGYISTNILTDTTGTDGSLM